MEWLGENGVPFSIIFTKADKLTNGKVKDNVNKYLKKLTEQWEELLYLIHISFRSEPISLLSC